MHTVRMKNAGRMNLRMRTAGGKVFWRDVHQASGLRLQQHVWWKDHHRILDDLNSRVWWDNCTEAAARAAFDEVRGGASPPRNPVEHFAKSLAEPVVDTAYQRIEKLLEANGPVAQRLQAVEVEIVSRSRDALLQIAYPVATVIAATLGLYLLAGAFWQS